MQTIRAGLVGITGYTGMELARLLANHPHMKLTMACSRSEQGQRLGEFYPFLEKLPGADVVISQYSAKQAKELCDVVFLAVPHGKAMVMAGELYREGLKVVDLSADFRIRDVETYEQWYVPHTERGLLSKAVYGLPELYEDEIKKASLIANPGCYPTSIILGLYPALSRKLVKTVDIVADSKSGTTGAGRKAKTASLFCEVYDSFKAYGIGGVHRHTPEIEQETSRIAGEPIVLSFNPHLVPMNRGILSCIYTKLVDESSTLEEIHKIYADCYKDKPWVRVLPAGKLPETRFVRGSMFCDIGLAVDKRTGRLIIVSAIDNVCRGASGQALANANLACGLPAWEGVGTSPLLP